MMKRMKAWIAMVSVGALLLQTASAGAPDPAWTAEKALVAEEAYIEGMDEAAVPAELVGELTELREAAVKYYRRSDGAVTAAVYDEPVHYEEDGAFVDIDNTLVAAKSGGRAVYMNKANGLKVELPAALDATAAVTVRSQGYALSWMAESLDSSLRDGRQAKAAAVEQPLSEAAWAEAAAERVEAALAAEKTEAAAEAKAKLMTSAQAAALSDARTEVRRIEAENEEMLAVNRQASAVTYGKALAGGADLRYDVRSNQLKESIVLSALPVQREFAFTIAAEGLEAVLNGDGSVSFYAADAAEDGEPVFVIAAPYMFDSSDRTSETYDERYSDQIKVTLEATDGGYRYALTPDRDWLEDAARVWPVTVDPTVTFGQDASQINAAQVYSRDIYANTNYSYSAFEVGQYSPVGGEKRTFMKVVLPSGITASSRVVDARLHLTYYNYTLYEAAVGNLQINAYQVSNDWNPTTITWNNQPSYNTTVKDYTYPKMGLPSTQWRGDSFDITSIVSGWTGGEKNYGIALACGNLTSTTDNTVEYYSNRNSITGLRPISEITYRDTKGLENYWTYTSLSAGDTTASVNNYNGHLVVTKPIAGVDGNRMPAGISMVYNEFQQSIFTSPNHLTAVGVGWRTNFHMTIQTSNIANYPYVLHDADGTEHYFYQDGSVYRDEDNLGYELTVASPGYILKTKDDMTYSFNRGTSYLGRLLSVKDTYGNTITVNYNSNYTISSITDGAGRSYSFTYSGSYVASITDPASRTTTFTYNGYYLASIKNPYNETTTFTYAKTTAAGYGMTKITAPDGSRVDIRQREGSNGAYTDAAAYTAATYSKKMLRVTRLTSYGTSGNVDMQYNFTLKHNALDVTAYSKNDQQNPDYKVGDMQYQFNNWGQTTCVVDRLSGMAQYYEQGKPKETTATDGTENKVTSVSKAHSSVVNLVKDGEYSSGLTYHSMTRVNANATVTADSTYGYISKRSLRFYQPSTGTPGYLYGYQYIQGLPAGTYTVSAYVSTNNGQLTGGAGVGLALNVYSASGTYLRSMPSEYVTKTGANEWKRVWATIQVNAGEELRIFPGYKDGTVGTAYIDGLQAEPGETVNHYNLLSNSSNYHTSTTWLSSHGMEVPVSNDGLPGGGRLMRMAGRPTNTGVIRQEFTNITGKAGDTYSFGSWARGEAGTASATPKNQPAYQRYAGRDSTFEIVVRFYNGTTNVESKVVQFNSFHNEWQFASGQAVFRGNGTVNTYDRISFELHFSYMIGFVRFARPFLYREAFDQSYAYDTAGNLISTTDLNNINSSFAYTNDDMTKLTNPSGSRYLYAYDEATRNLMLAHSSSGQRTDFTYDGYGNATKAVTTAQKPVTSVAAGKKYFIRSAASGRSLSVASIGIYQAVQTAGYDEANTKQPWTLVADGTGYYALKVYNSTSTSWIATASTSSSGASVGLFPQSATNNGQKFKFESAGDGTFRIKSYYSTYLDTDGAAAGASVKVMNSDNTKESQKWYVYEYKTATELNAAGYIQTNAGYSADGNYMTSLTNERNKTTTYAYNTLKGRLNSATDPRGVITSNTYDSDDRLSKLSTANGAYTAAVEYKYDTSDRLTGIWHNNNLVRYALGYDQFNRRTSVMVGNSAGSTRTLANYVYNSVGLLSYMYYGNGWGVQNSYDTLGRVSKTAYNINPAGSMFNTAEEYVYNADGQVGIYKDHVANQRTRYTYDLSGRLVGSHTTTGAATERTYGNYSASTPFAREIAYDDIGRVSNYRTLLDNGATTMDESYVYGTKASGEIDYVKAVKLDGAQRVTYAYDSFGRVSQRTAGVPTTYTYEAVGTAGRTTNTVSSMTTGGDTLAYTYDANGNILTVTRNGMLQESFAYDSLGQLIQHDQKEQLRTFVYTYDKGGNITSRKDYAYGYSTGTPIQTMSYTYGDSMWADLLTNYNGSSIGYDTIGNPLTYRSGMTMAWTNGRRLASIGSISGGGGIAGGGAATFSYNAGGQRTAKTAAGVTHSYVWDGSTLVQEKWGSNSLIFLSDASGGYYGFKYNGTLYYYVFNIQGDVIQIVNSSGAIVARYSYDAWGKPLKVQDHIELDVSSNATHIANVNPIRYRGYYYDRETGLYATGTRYYDPVVGRFINADGLVSTGQGVLGNNMFAYCLNNPVNMSDPSGMCAEFSGPCFIHDTVGGKKAHEVFNSTGDYIFYSSVKSPTAPTKEQEGIAATLVGEAGNTGDWKTMMDALSHAMVNCTYVFPDSYATPFDAAKNRMNGGYQKGLSRIGDDSYAVAWDYAMGLAGYVVSGQYNMIPRPEGITGRHVSNFLAADFKKGQKAYDEWADHDTLVYIGTEVFYAEQGKHRKG